eukprot:XP_766506.1 hypothetical protein [Theileria parva strain Muguga]
MCSGQIAPLKCVHVDDIDINFKDSLYDASYILYNHQIHSIWLVGHIKDVNHELEFFDFDDNSGRPLRIQYCRKYIEPQVKDKNIIKVGNRVSIICGISHLIIGKEAYLNFRVNRISKAYDFNPEYFSAKVKAVKITNKI